MNNKLSKNQNLSLAVLWLYGVAILFMVIMPEYTVDPNATLFNYICLALVVCTIWLAVRVYRGK